MDIPQKTKNRSIIWSINPTPGTYPNRSIIQKDNCTPMFIATLFPTAKTWWQPKFPTTNEWIKKMRYIYTVEYYSALKIDHAICCNMNATEIITLIKISVKVWMTNTMISFICGIQKKKIIKTNLHTQQQKQTCRFQKQTYGYQMGKVRGGIN